jgi:TonB family protein
MNHDKIIEKYRFDIAYALEDNWNAPKLSGEVLEGLKTSIIITVLPSGKFADFIIVNSSGNDEWDNSVIAAIEKTDPFRPFPKGISSDQVKVGINFTPNRIN